MNQLGSNKLGIKKILMTTDCIGGIWTYSLELIKALQKYNIEVLLAVTGGKLDISQKEESNEIKNLTVREKNLKLEWMENPWEDMQIASDWLMSLEREFKPDILHLNSYSFGALEWNVPSLIVAHSCVFSWYHSVKGGMTIEENIKWSKYREKVSEGLNKASMVTAPSNFMLSQLSLMYGSFNMADPVYNGIDTKQFRPFDKEDYIFSAGRLWDEAKNINLLVETADRVLWNIYLAGDISEDKNGNTNRFFYNDYSKKDIISLGKLSRKEISSWMGNASIYVHPAKYEPFGLTPLEAALSGCALILGDIPSLREIWGDSAVFIPVNDQNSLTEAINTLVNNRELRNSKAYDAMERAKNYNSELMADNYFRLYQNITG